MIEQHRADAVLAHRSDAMGQQEPSRLGFDRRAAIADLHNLPGILGCLDLTCPIPVTDVVGFHEIKVFVVDPRDHGVFAVESVAGKAPFPCSWRSRR